MARVAGVSPRRADALQPPSALHHHAFGDYCYCCSRATAGLARFWCCRKGYTSDTSAVSCCSCGGTASSISPPRSSTVEAASSFHLRCMCERAITACPSFLRHSPVQALPPQQEKQQQQQEDEHEETRHAGPQLQSAPTQSCDAAAAALKRSRRKSRAPSTAAAAPQLPGERATAGTCAASLSERRAPEATGGRVEEEAAGAVAAEVAEDAAVNVITAATEAGAGGTERRGKASRRRPAAATTGGELPPAAPHTSVEEYRSSKLCVFPFLCEGFHVEAAPAAGDSSRSVVAAAPRQRSSGSSVGAAAEAAATEAAVTRRQIIFTVPAAAATNATVSAETAAAADVVVVSKAAQIEGATPLTAGTADNPTSVLAAASGVLAAAEAPPTVGGSRSETLGTTAICAKAAAGEGRGGEADRTGEAAAATEALRKETAAPAGEARATKASLLRMAAAGATAAEALRAVLGLSPRLLVATESPRSSIEQRPPRQQQTYTQQPRLEQRQQQQPQKPRGTRPFWVEEQQHVQDNFEQLQQRRQPKQPQQELNQQHEWGGWQQQSTVEEGCSTWGVLFEPSWRAQVSAAAADNGVSVAAADWAPVPLAGIERLAARTRNVAISRFSNVLVGCSCDLDGYSPSSCSLKSGSRLCPSFPARSFLVGQGGAAASVDIRSSSRSGAVLLLLLLLLRVGLSSSPSTPLSAALANISGEPPRFSCLLVSPTFDAPAAAANSPLPYRPTINSTGSHPYFIPTSFSFVIGADAAGASAAGVAATFPLSLSPLARPPSLLLRGRSSHHGVVAARLAAAAAAAAAAVGYFPTIGAVATAAGGGDWADVGDEESPARGPTRLAFECLYAVFYSVISITAVLQAGLSLLALLALLVLVSTSFYAALLLSPLLLLRPFLRLSLHITAQAAYYLVAGCCACIAACLTVAVFSTLQQLLL